MSEYSSVIAIQNFYFYVSDNKIEQNSQQNFQTNKIQEKRGLFFELSNLLKSRIFRKQD